MDPDRPGRLTLLVARDGHHAADDAVIALGLLDLVACGAWSRRRHGWRRRWRMQRLGSPPPDDRGLTALDRGLEGVPAEAGYVPVQALGWWMRHYAIGATRVRDAAREDLAARRFRVHVPDDAKRPDRHADDVAVALGGFPSTSAERDFVTQLLRARDRPTGLVTDDQASRTTGLGAGGSSF